MFREENSSDARNLQEKIAGSSGGVLDSLNQTRGTLMVQAQVNMLDDSNAKEEHTFADDQEAELRDKIDQSSSSESSSGSSLSDEDDKTGETPMTDLDASRKASSRQLMDFRKKTKR